MFKLFVFAPNEERIIKAIISAAADAGAGVIGKYTHCAFVASGKGTWFAGKNTNPKEGKKNRLEYINHVKIEMVCPKDKAQKAADAIRTVHPYEEIAIDVIKLENI